MQIAEQKDAAIRGLSNYMFMEAQRMAKVWFTSSHHPVLWSLAFKLIRKILKKLCCCTGGCQRQFC